MRLIIFIVITLLLSACSVPSNRAKEVDIALKSTVRECEFLGQVYGESKLSFLAAGLDEAKYKALDQAAFLEASHVVWTDLQAEWRPRAVGRAYRCTHNADQYYNHYK